MEYDSNCVISLVGHWGMKKSEGGYEDLDDNKKLKVWTLWYKQEKCCSWEYGRKWPNFSALYNVKPA